MNWLDTIAAGVSKALYDHVGLTGAIRLTTGCI